MNLKTGYLEIIPEKIKIKTWLQTNDISCKKISKIEKHWNSDGEGSSLEIYIYYGNGERKTVTNFLTSQLGTYFAEHFKCNFIGERIYNDVIRRSIWAYSFFYILLIGFLCYLFLMEQITKIVISYKKGWN